MDRQIDLGGRMLEYRALAVKRSRKLRITVRGDGSVLVTRPWRMSLAKAEAFLKEKSDWVLGHLDECLKQPLASASRGTKSDYAAQKEKARRLVRERLEYFNRFYGFQFGRISIRNQRSRWGSCSKKGNLNFNYRLAGLDPKIADYVIVHELCHLQEFNHSPRFWELVSRTIPDYVACRRLLKY